jgi:hypothetical protein
MPSELRENVLKSVDFLEVMMHKHSLVCDSLEMEKSWPKLINKWFYPGVYRDSIF